MRTLTYPIVVIALIFGAGATGCPDDDEIGSAGVADTGSAGDVDTGYGGDADIGSTDDTSDDISGDMSDDGAQTDAGGTNGTAFCGDSVEEAGEACDNAYLMGGDSRCSGQAPVCALPSFVDIESEDAPCSCVTPTCPFDGEMPSLNDGVQIGADAGGARRWQTTATLDGTWEVDGADTEHELIALLSQGDFSPPLFCGGVLEPLLDSRLATLLVPEGASCDADTPCPNGQVCIEGLCVDVACDHETPCEGEFNYCTAPVDGVCRAPDLLSDFVLIGGDGAADAIYTFTAVTGGVHVFSVEGGLGTDTILYVIEACDPRADVFACSDDRPDFDAENGEWMYALTSRVYVELDAGETVYAVVDAWSGHDDGFEYTVTVSEVTLLGEGDRCNAPADGEHRLCNESMGLFCLAGETATCGFLGGAPHLETANVTVELNVTETAEGRCGEAGSFDVFTAELTGTASRAIMGVNMSSYFTPYWSDEAYFFPIFDSIPFRLDAPIEPDESGAFNVTIVECLPPEPLVEGGPSFAELVLTAEEVGGNPLYFQVVDAFVSTGGDNTQLDRGWYWLPLEYNFLAGFPSNWVMDEVVQ